jgi:hypothetical protein
MEDLEEERNKIASEIMRSQYIPIMAEFVFNVRDNPKETLEKEFDKCDGYIGVFHKRWGYVPENDNPERLSITAIEYTWAKKRNIPRFILKPKYKKEDELKKFIDKISDMQEGNWVKSYEDSNDLILQVVRGLPTLIDAIKNMGNKVQVFNNKDLSVPSLYIIDSNPHDVTKERIQDFSKEIIEPYAETINTSSKPDVKYVAWRYLGKLAVSKRLWNHDKIWNTLDTEILVDAPTQFFFDATSILKWMLRNSELDFRTQNNSTMNKARQNYLAK